MIDRIRTAWRLKRYFGFSWRQAWQKAGEDEQEREWWL